MKITKTSHSRLSRRLFRHGMLVSIAASGWLAQASAEAVDSELILLVDATRGGLNNSQFNDLMEGYATTFTSAATLDSIQSGAFGRIAISLMFFGNASTQVVGIPWMMIGNASQATQFADLVRSVSRPSAVPNPDIASALTAATLHFGTETGGSDNGFESQVQIIEVASAKSQPRNTGGSAAAASGQSLISGVDLINSVALGNQANTIASFYESNVVGSSIAGVTPSSSVSQFDGNLAAALGGLLTESVQTGATMSVSAVPETVSLFGLIPVTFLVLRRARR